MYVNVLFYACERKEHDKCCVNIFINKGKASCLNFAQSCTLCNIFFIAANMEKKGPLQSVQVFGRKVSQNDDEEHNGRHWILWRSVL